MTDGQPPPPAADPLSRHRALQVISILLIVGGLLTIIAVLILEADLLFSGPDLDPSQLGRAVVALLVILAGGVATVVGLVMNAVRAIVVRAALPRTRYRGASIFVLLLIAAVLASIGSIAAGADLLALQSGGELTVRGSLVLLTINQISLLAVAGFFVVAPRDVAVMRIDPTVLILALVLVAPLAEELFFRGVVYNAWLREYGPRTALFGSAALFAVIHANPQSGEALIGSVVSIVPIFGLGIVLALVYRRTGSLAASMALHAGFNAISVTVALLVRAGVLDIPLPT